ncbi:MAG: nucleotidyl transferase AbiEii/AbiGii toxin family protein [Chlamydiales bacterium]
MAKERSITPAEVWQNVIHERFLCRLCRSPFSKNFILKGGVLLAKYVDIGRETKDLDFSTRNIPSDFSQLTEIIHRISAIDLNDGFGFSEIKVEPLEHFHMEYSGARIKMQGCLGKARLPLFIDQKYWESYRPITIFPNRLPAHINVVINSINTWIN